VVHPASRVHTALRAMTFRQFGTQLGDDYH